jgi:hypothetical protein
VSPLSGWTAVILAVPGSHSAQALAMLIAAFPFAFALIRALRTGHDFRYLCVALASLLGAMAVMAVGKAHIRRAPVAVALSAGAFVGSTLLAVLAALPLGTKLGPGILVVAVAFGFCCAAGSLLYTLARHRTD